MPIAGLDIGTTGCKITVYDNNGEFLNTFYQEYEASRRSGWHELIPGTAWDAVQEVIRESTQKHPVMWVFERGFAKGV